MDDPNNTHGHSKKDLIIKSSREIILKWATIHFRDFIEQLDQHLSKLIEKPGSNTDKTRYMQTRIELNNQHDNIQSLFLHNIENAFDQYLKCEQTVTAPNTSSSEASTIPLSLVDNSDLEETLTINTMSRKINSQCAEILHFLNQRFAALRGGSKMTIKGNPIAPGVFAEAVKNAITELTLDSISKLVTYKLFESVFMGQLFKLYNLLSKHYEQHGLLPNLTRLVKKNQSAELPNELKSQNSDVSIANQVKLFSTIKQLQAQYPVNTNVPEYTLPLTQIIASIGQLQRDAANLLSSLENPQSILAADTLKFRQQSEREAFKTEGVDTHIVEIVGLLFEYMLSDQQLPNSVKALLSYLHTPILKIALQDKDFFNHPEHPARQLLNSLVAAGERWVEPTGKHKHDVFLQIKLIVQRLLDEFDNNVRLFSELAFEFNHYLRQHTRRIRLSEKRALQAAQGENKLKEIRLKVDTYLKGKVGNVKLTSAIYTLLFEPWANFLSFNLLRFGSKSEQWQLAAKTVDDVLWVSQPHNKNDIKSQHRFSGLILTLPKTLQAGFDTVGYDSLQGAQLLKTLTQQFKLNAKTSPDNVTDITQEPSIDANIDNVDLSAHTQQLSQKDELHIQLKSLEVGTWFIFDEGTSKAQHAKLAWLNATTLHFMFVNRMGQQVAVKTGEQLAKEIRENSAKILDKLEEKPFFEKAMENVLEQLKQRVSQDNPTKQ